MMTPPERVCDTPLRVTTCICRVVVGTPALAGHVCLLTTRPLRVTGQSPHAPTVPSPGRSHVPPYNAAIVCGGEYCHTKIPPSLPTDTMLDLSGVTATRVTVPLCATPMK